MRQLPPAQAGREELPSFSSPSDSGTLDLARVTGLKDPSLLSTVLAGRGAMCQRH